MLKNYLKIILSILTLFSLSSCKDKEPVEASSGIAQQTTVFAKTCDQGSLKITKETETSAGVPYVLNVDDLPIGAKVTVSGTVNNGSVCGFTGPVSFSCKATVRVDLNKAFSCVSEHFISGASDYLGTTLNSTPALPNTVSPGSPVSHQRALHFGDFIIYYGATRTFTSLTVNSSSPLAPTTCKLSFICD